MENLLKKFLFLWLVLIILCPSPSAEEIRPPFRITVLGDSLSAGFGLPAADAFPAKLEEALQGAGRAVHVVNAGVSGDTTAGGLSRLDWALADAPEVVIVELGGNDALRGLDPGQTSANLNAILERLSEREVQPILVGMRAPRNLGEEYYNKFDSIFPRLAARHDVPFYPFFLEGVAGNPSLNQPDGIHPNAEGVAEIVRRILPLILHVVDAAEKGKTGP